MGYEGLPISPEEQQPTSEEEAAKYKEEVLPKGPRLRSIYKTLELLNPENDELGNELNWKELSKFIQPYHNSLELSDNVREVVREYVAQKIPAVKEKISAIEDLDDAALLNALTNNWFEEVDDDVGGSRKEILLMVMASIVRRIETYTYKQHLEELDAEELEKLGLTPGLRDLLSEVMDASIKANSLYIRFAALTQKMGTPPEEAEREGIVIPGIVPPLTMGTLFPHETQFIAKRFEDISKEEGEWDSVPGAHIFKKYLFLLAQYHKEADQDEARKYLEESEQLYKELLEMKFPIVITPGLTTGYKDPYLDPELRISLVTPDTQEEEQAFDKAKHSMAESLDALGLSKYEQAMHDSLVRSRVSVGGYGANLTLNAVAQEHPVIVIYLNDQIRTYDRDFPAVLEQYISNETSLSPELLERISRMNTILHEMDHVVYPDTSPEADRLGWDEPSTIIDETKAETLFRALIPKVIAKGGLEGDREDWAIGMLGTSIQMLKDQPEDDPYFYSNSYILNNMFKRKAITFENKKLTILDYDAYYEAMHQAARSVLDLYENPSTTERKAGKWIQDNAVPSKKTAQFVKFLKK